MVIINNRWQNATAEKFNDAIEAGQPARKRQKDSKEWIIYPGKKSEAKKEKPNLIVWKP